MLEAAWHGAVEAWTAQRESRPESQRETVVLFLLRMVHSPYSAFSASSTYSRAPPPLLRARSQHRCFAARRHVGWKHRTRFAHASQSMRVYRAHPPAPHAASAAASKPLMLEPRLGPEPGPGAPPSPPPPLPRPPTPPPRLTAPELGGAGCRCGVRAREKESERYRRCVTH
jgi:hypothetical protein